MALPASGPISMSMVAAEFEPEIGANMSLSASAALLSTPVASNIFLAASFYGQSLVTLTAFGYSGTEPFEDASSACSEGGTSGTAYHNGSGTFPAVDDLVFQDSAGSTPLSDGFYRMNSGQSLEIEDETAMAVANCGR